jgi:hypothetical protein
MNELTVRPEASAEVGEAKSLARELADAYRDRVQRYKYELRLSPEEAMAKAEEPGPLDRMFAIQEGPHDRVTWEELEELNRHGPGVMLDRWREIEQAALEQLRSGHWAAGVVEERHSSGPWQRALCLAIRTELAEGWQPRNGVERQLIDQMAQAQAAMYCWQQRLAYAAETNQAGEPEGAMVDRFNRIFLRTLRALCNLRKVPLAVVVQNAGQVNVGGQQVNVAAGESGTLAPE